MPIPKSQQPRVRSQHPPTQWNLKGGRLSTVNKVKNPKNPPVCLNMCIEVSLYRPINICLYWRIYVCMYRLEYQYQCIIINLTVIGKECKNKKYLQSYKYMLALAYLCVYVSA